MPRRWTLILRDHSEAARPMRAEDCHGLLNRWWPHPGAEHTAAKRWAMNGWPRPLGDRLWHWTLTWLDEAAPPRRPEELVGRLHRIGDHLLEPLSATTTFERGYTEIIAGAAGIAPVRAARLCSLSPVLTFVRDGAGEAVPCSWPSPRRLFGAVHRSGGRIQGGSGVLGAVARFAPADAAGPWLERVARTVALVRRLPLAEEPVRTAEHPHAEGRTVVGWEGGMRLELPGGAASAAAGDLAALLELVELTGVGKYTAQGFGAVRVDTLTRGGRGAERPAPRVSRAPGPDRTAGGRGPAPEEAPRAGPGGPFPD